jgi:hypothetical protein
MKNIFIISLGLLLLTSCSHSITRGTQYAKFYEEKPVSVLVMPPINNTTHPEAKEYFYSSLSYPLCEKGYYVVSPFLAMDLLKQESAYDSENFINGSITPFKNVFGVDAVLFTVIDDWTKQSLLNKIDVKIEYILKSTKTGEILFDRKGKISVDCSVTSNGGLLGMALNIISTAVTDKIVAARRCNEIMLYDFPAGKYSPLFGKDMKLPAEKQEIK